MKKVVSFLFFLAISATTVKSNDYKIFQSLEKKNLKEFNEVLKKTCQNDRFFKNLVSHTSYPKYGSKKNWIEVCKKIKKTKIDKNFLTNKNFKTKLLSQDYGILTGYYEPEIKVSRIKTSNYSIPILKYNKKFRKMKRRLINKKFSSSDVLLWTNDIIDFFFLQIQGSGVGVFENGEKTKILYSENNNLKYTSIGNILIKKKYLDKKKVNLFSIKKFLRENPNKVKNILNENDRYIFFKLNSDIKTSPVGAFGINLVPYVSLAVDKKYYPLGIPILYKERESKNYKPSLAIDTGSAIKGKNRADLFTGSGKDAENKAGMLKKKLLLYVLIPYID